ncbi:STAS domain-containing protein [Alkalicoccus urumqiensis]|uniref:STAS domain-containing protein n=1 Tax=Alkalicoccus urumqiensis TaxID=1548213 RepID=A0A2P6MEK0_ALKUR|nr:STAS domain-containing protein [Alkalicoccus urumqiensis]PRO64677.1 hypothetical protein C6I21_13300 [Alkalicoccus urumqiensis]
MAETEVLKQLIGKRLLDNQQTLAEEIHQGFQDKHAIRYTRISADAVIQHAGTLIEKVGMELIGEGSSTRGMREWGRAFGTEAASLQLSADKAMLVVPVLRRVLYSRIRSVFQEEQGEFEAYFDIADTVNPMIDQAIYAFTQAYFESQESRFQDAQDEILELSVPVVPVTSDVAILPIIGSVDSDRSQQLMSQALEKSRELKLRTLILDLSGVHTIDTYVAQNLFQLNDALRISGVQVILCGLRPELVQTIVHLGISFDQLTVVNNLPQALAKTGLTVSDS